MKTGIDLLADYVVLAAAQHPELLKEPIKRAGLEEAISGEHLIVGTVGEARLSILIAEALLQMGAEMHPDDDPIKREELEEEKEERVPVTPAAAVVLVKEYGGIRPAARATGLGRTRLSNAVRRAARATGGS